MLGEIFLDHGRSAGLGKRILRALLAAIFCLFVVGISVVELQKTQRVSAWQPVACQILESGVESVGDGFRRLPYRAHVEYAYQFEEHRLSHLEEFAGSDSAVEAYGLARSYPPGMRTACYVNPLVKSEAVLRRTSPLGAELFCGSAVLIALIVILLYCVPQVFFYRCAKRKVHRPAIELVSALGLFLGFGAMFVFRWGLPIQEQLRSHKWVPIRATVVESNIIKTEEVGEYYFVSYRTDIHYRYVCGGVTYDSNCYNLTEGQTLLGFFRASFARSYSAGQKVICYVNPNDPQTAVLSRRLSAGVFNGAWAAVFSVLGALGVITGGNGERMKRIFGKIGPAIVVGGVVIFFGFIWGQLASP